MHTFGEIKETVEAPRYPLSGNGHPGSPHHPDTLIFMVYHMFNATLTKGKDRTNAKCKKKFKIHPQVPQRLKRPTKAMKTQ
jgi:hypothetical protein